MSGRTLRGGYLKQDDDRGTLYGVGVGPGAPDLMTLRAARLIEGAVVIAYPTLAGADSFARSIAVGLIPAGVEEIVMDVPMTTDRAPAQAAYDAGAARIAAALERGQDVVCLCEGDPFFYGSFMYLFARLSGTYRCEVVPGVTSVTACAARAGRPLVARNERLTVLPGPLPEADLRDRIAGGRKCCNHEGGASSAKAAGRDCGPWTDRSRHLCRKGQLAGRSGAAPFRSP